MSSSYPLLSPGQPRDPLTINHFFDSTNSFSTQLSTFLSTIDDLRGLHESQLRNTDSSTGYGGGTSRLEGATTECSKQARELKDFLKRLELDQLLTERDGNLQEARMKKQHCERLKKELVEAVRGFEMVERNYRTQVNEQLRRQYLIVNPSATEAELSALLDNSSSHDTNTIFSSALLQSSRIQGANSALTAAKERHASIQRIEATIQELALLFEQMEEMVELQAEVINDVETKADMVVKDTEKADMEVETAVRLAKSARRKRWWCLLIGISIVVVIVVIVVVVLVLRNQGASNSAPKRKREVAWGDM
ncbi:t-SNARE [Pyronema omphalodes]|nr:t-SNARE [Pyronema omphalodes]